MSDLVNLTPLEQLRAPRLTRRVLQLLIGLALYGVSMGMLVRATLGLDPWDVLHAGLARHLPLSFGMTVVLVGALVLLAWIPMRQMPGLGTVLNVALVGPATDLTLSLLATPTGLLLQILLMVGGVFLNGLATALYIGSQLGPGPRDGLMTGLVRLTGQSVRGVRTALEVAVVAVGFALGGAVGVGTVLYALSIGPLVHALLPRCTVSLAD